MRILLAEDDAAIAAAVRASLEQGGHAVDHVADGSSADHALRDHDYDLLVLDLGLPLLDGSDVLARARKRGAGLPVLVVTAREGLKERVRVLDLGADDYLVKPFALVELAARLRALNRRHRSTEGPVLKVGDLELDPAARTAKRSGRLIPLTPKEYALLDYFMHRAGVVLTRAMIAEHVWDYTFDNDSNVVDVHVKHLRDKVDDPGRPSLIQAVRGVGYVLRDPAETPA